MFGPSQARTDRPPRPDDLALSAIDWPSARRADHDEVLDIRTAPPILNTSGHFALTELKRLLWSKRQDAMPRAGLDLGTVHQPLRPQHPIMLVIVRYWPTTMTPLAVGRDHGWLMSSAFTLKSLALLAGSAATKYSTDDLTGRKMTPSCPCQNNTPHQTRCTDDICCCCTKGIQRHMTCGAKRGLHRGRRRDAH